MSVRSGVTLQMLLFFLLVYSTQLQSSMTTGTLLVYNIVLLYFTQLLVIWRQEFLSLCECSDGGSHVLMCIYKLPCVYENVRGVCTMMWRILSDNGRCSLLCSFAGFSFLIFLV